MEELKAEVYGNCLVFETRSFSCFGVAGEVTEEENDPAEEADLPAGSTPAEETPVETEPAETTPAETEPAEESNPAEETSPAETEPAETEPAEESSPATETTPAETSSAETEPAEESSPAEESDPEEKNHPQEENTPAEESRSSEEETAATETSPSNETAPAEEAEPTQPAAPVLDPKSTSEDTPSGKQKLSASDGDSYEVLVSTGEGSALSADTVLSVTELPLDDPSYQTYLDSALAALELDAAQMLSARIFDIALKDIRTDKACQPDQEVTVTIRLLDQEPDDAAILSVVHFPGTSFAESEDLSKLNNAKTARGLSVKTPEVLECLEEGKEIPEVLENEKENLEIPDDSTECTEISFKTSSFSVYVLISHEGETQVVTPRVEFHFIDKDYTEGTGDSEGIYTAGPYNFLNKADPEEYQCSQILTDGESLEMIANPANIVVGDSEKFFYGWYVVDLNGTDNTAYNKTEGKWNGTICYSWPADPEKVDFGTAMMLTDESGNPLTSETALVAGETVLNWAIGDAAYSGTLDSDGILHVYLAPIYEDYYFLNFRMGSLSDSTGVTNSLLTRKLVVLGSDEEVTVRIGDIVCPSSDPTHLVFAGWQTAEMAEETDVSKQYYPTVDLNNGGTEANSSGSATGYYITVTEDDFTGTTYDLYPLFVEARWLNFSTGKSGNGSKYVGSTYRLTNDEGAGTYYTNTFFSTNATSRSGYNFGGWYAFANMDGETSEITNLLTAQDVEVTYQQYETDPSTGKTTSTTKSVTFNMTAIQLVNGSNELVTPSDNASIATTEKDGVTYTLKASDGIIYLNIDGTDYKLFGVENGNLYFYKPMNDLTLYARWLTQLVSYKILYWEQLTPVLQTIINLLTLKSRRTALRSSSFHAKR